MTYIKADRAVFGYGTTPVVRVDSLHVDAGQCLGMFGPNGSGKTTLVRGLAGLLPPLDGAVQRLGDLRIGYLQQQRTLELQWPMSGLDAAALAVSARRRFGWMGGARLGAVRSFMALLEVDELASLAFASLSGGQQQRVLLAGALAADPQLLILDEPTEGLDVRSRRILLGALRDAASGGLATILISHALDDLAHSSDEVAWFHEPQSPGDPAWVEVVSVSDLVERVTALRTSA